MVCPDTIRRAIHGQQFIALAEPYVWAVAETMVRSLLREGHNVIVDATNTTKKRRDVWVRVASEEGKPFIGFWVDTPAEECIKRNKELNRIDPKIIQRMVDQFEEPYEIEDLRIAGSGAPRSRG